MNSISSRSAPVILLFSLLNSAIAGTAIEFRGPFGVAVNSKDVIYAAEIDGKRVAKLSADGHWLGAIDHIEGYGALKGPFDVAIGPRDWIYITDCLNHKVLVLNESEEMQFVLGKDAKGSEPGAFSEPHFVTVNEKGEIFVADTFNARIQKFSAKGELIGSWGRVGTGPGEFLHNGYLARVDVDGLGHVYVREFDGGRIQKFTEDGTHVATFSQRGTERGQLDEGYGLSVIDGKLYCPDTFESRVQIFSLDGQLLEGWDPGEGGGDGQFNHPVDIARLSDGRLVLSDWKNNRLVLLSATGKFLESWGQSAKDFLAYEPPEWQPQPERRKLRFGIYGACDERTIDACHECGIDMIYYAGSNRDGDWGISGAVKKAKTLNVEIHPSIAMLVFGQESMRFINAHPELTMWKKGATEPLKTILAWSQPEARSYRANHLVDQAEKSGVQGVLLDYIRYLGTEYGYDPNAVEEFSQKHGMDPNTIPQTNRRWMQFRADYVTDFITELRHKLATNLEHHVEISVYLSGSDPANESYLKTSLQDWRTWARMGIVDKVHVAVYSRDFDAIYQSVRKVREAIPDRVILDCMIACYGGNLNSPELLRKGYEVAIAAGSDEVTLYRSDAIWEQNAWETMKDIIGEHRQ